MGPHEAEDEAGVVGNTASEGDGGLDLVPLPSHGAPERNSEWPSSAHEHMVAGLAELPPRPIGSLSPTVVTSPSQLEDARKRRANSKVVSWGDLPRKDQLFVITLARLSEPLVQTSIQSYMFYQLKWFDPTLPDSVISSQAGVLQYGFLFLPHNITAHQDRL
jgi:hypothetical protein